MGLQLDLDDHAFVGLEIRRESVYVTETKRNDHPDRDLFVYESDGQRTVELSKKLLKQLIKFFSRDENKHHLESR